MKTLLSKFGTYLLRKKWFQKDIINILTNEINKSNLDSELNVFVRKNKRSLITILRKEPENDNITNLLEAIKNSSDR